MAATSRDGSSRGQRDPIAVRARRELRQRFDRAMVEARRRLAPPRTTRPAFLVGCGRSGTNMVSWQLDRSWRIELVNEHDERAFEAWRLTDPADIANVVAGSRAGVVLFKPILDTPVTAELLRRYPTGQAIFMSRQVDDVVNSAARLFGPGHWSRRVRGWIRSDFREFQRWPPPSATTRAVVRLWREGLDDASISALYWLFYNRLYFDLELDTSPGVLLLRYEDVVHEPVAQLTAASAHLGIASPDLNDIDVFGSSVSRDPGPELDPAIRAACDELWSRLTAS